MDLFLRHEGGGVLRPASRHDFELVTGAFRPGETVHAKILRRRSATQNRFFHALIESAFDNQRAGPTFPTWRHLKGWLLIQADHCDTIRFDPGAMTPAVAVALRRQFDTVDFTTDGKSIFMKIARSVRFNATDSAEMGEVVDKVIALICTEIVPGADPESIMREAKDRSRARKSHPKAA